MLTLVAGIDYITSTHYLLEFFVFCVVTLALFSWVPGKLTGSRPGIRLSWLVSALQQTTYGEG